MGGASSPAIATALRARAALVAGLRQFFASRACCEVTTPALVPAQATEAALASYAVGAPDGRAAGFLRTSPESAMKCLLAAGSGDIYQLGPVFRADEAGPRHLAEFTLLEWYRVGFDHHRLMDEVTELLRAVGCARPVRRLRYAELFERAAGLDPHLAATPALADRARDLGLALDTAAADDRALLLDALYALAVEPALVSAGVVLVHDFPVPLRAYARLGPGTPAVAERFELVIDGLEVANGYHEITDAAEQAACFASDAALRARRGLPPVAPDEAWLAALRAGLPDCAGIALGVERLAMTLTGAATIDGPAALPSRKP